MAKPTRAQMWRSRTEVIELPSGMDCEVRVINGIAAITRNGKIPNALSSVLMDTNKTGRWNPQDAEQLGEVMETAKVVARRVLVSPKVVDGEPDEANDEVTIEDIPQGDLFFIFSWAMGGKSADMQAATEFPGGGEDGRVPDVPDGGSVQAAAE